MLEETATEIVDCRFTSRKCKRQYNTLLHVECKKFKVKIHIAGSLVTDSPDALLAAVRLNVIVAELKRRSKKIAAKLWWTLTCN